MSPIRGLTDRGAAFPRIGELRKGDVKPEQGNRPGADLKHFRFTSDDPAAVAAFDDAYGKEPRSIRCYLPYQGVEANFQTFMEEWLKGGLVRRCDGETIQIERTPKGTYDRTPHPCPNANGGKCACKQVGRLSVIVPELRRFAYVVALTSSIHDIIEIHSNLTAAMEIKGDLRGIPFILSRKPREISMPGQDGQRVRREKWLLSIEPAPTWVQAQIEALPQFDEPLQLPAPDEDGVIETTATKVIVPTNGDAKPPAVSTSPATNSNGHSEPAPEGIDTAAVQKHIDNAKRALSSGSYPSSKSAGAVYGMLKGVAKARGFTTDELKPFTPGDDPHVTTLLHTIKALGEAILAKPVTAKQQEEHGEDESPF